MTAEISVPTQADISADTEMSENRRNRHFGISFGRHFGRYRYRHRRR
jgi:hypothetical protein